jgi:hypothetical protein
MVNTMLCHECWNLIEACICERPYTQFIPLDHLVELIADDVIADAERICQEAAA